MEPDKIITGKVIQTQKDKCASSQSSDVVTYPGVTAETSKMKRGHCQDWGIEGATERKTAEYK